MDRRRFLVVICRSRRLQGKAPLEPLILAALLTVDGALAAARAAPLEFLATALMSAAGVLFLRQSRASLVTLCAAVVVLAVVPAPQIALSVYTPLIVLVFCLQEGSKRNAAAVTVAGSASALWSCRRAHSMNEWMSALLVWTLMYVLAWVLGRGLWRVNEQTKALHAAELAAQRRTIAAELHDNVAHELTMMVLRAESGRRDPATSMTELETIARLGRHANQQLRTMMRLLQVQETVRPMTLPDALADGQRRLTEAGITGNVTVDGDLSALDAGVADCLARVLREAINNAVRHADKSYPCAVFVEVTDERARMAVRNQRAYPDRPLGSGLGLEGMAQRVEAVGGHLTAGPQGDMWLVRLDTPVRA